MMLVMIIGHRRRTVSYLVIYRQFAELMEEVNESYENLTGFGMNYQLLVDRGCGRTYPALSVGS
jgi:hypothetical protein